MPGLITYAGSSNLVTRYQHSDALGSPVTRTRQIGTDTAREDQYTYDNIGNREQANEAETTHYITNGLNQYTDINGNKPAYDLDGNQTNVRTSTGNWQISYNDQGRPEHITSEDGATQVQCTYDHMGRRVRKTVSRQGRVVKDHTFAYRDYLQVAAFDILNNGAPVHTILWDPSEPVSTRPLCITTADGQTHYYGWDHNKNVTELFDEAGKLAATYDYTPYGELLKHPDEGIGTDNPFRYSSEYHDEELGLIYYNYRHYNPTNGRWISRDPIHEQGDWNLYGFVGNNASYYIDYLGKFPTTLHTPAGLQAQLISAGLLGVASLNAKNLSDFANKLEWDTDTLANVLKELKLRKKWWLCAAWGSTIKISSAPEETCCPEWVSGAATGPNKALTEKAAKKAANDNTPSGCHAKHLQVYCKQL